MDRYFYQKNHENHIGFIVDQLTFTEAEYKEVANLIKQKGVEGKIIPFDSFVVNTILAYLNKGITDNTYICDDIEQGWERMKKLSQI